MAINNKEILDATDVALSQTSSSFDCEGVETLTVACTLAGNNASNTSFNTGVMDVKTFTFPAKAGITDGDHVIFYEPDGTSWAIALDTNGTTAPSGSSAWDAVAAGNKVVVDCTSTTDAASVAAAVELAVDALTGFTAVITTDDTAADGTMTFTQVVPGVVSDAVPLDDTAAGAGSITVANTTPGTATDINISTDTITETAHGYLTGMKVTELTTTGTLPAGLSTSTVYYIIKVDDDSYQLAADQADAAAGTAVDITDYGTSGAVHTVVVATALAGSVKLQKNIEPSTATANWIDLDNTEVLNANNSQSFSAAGNLQWVIRDVCFSELRAIATVTSGIVTTDVRCYAKLG